MLVIVLASSIVLLIACAAFALYDQYAFCESLKSNLSTLSKIIASTSGAALDLEDKDAAAEFLKSLEAKQHILAACFYQTNGTILARYFRSNYSGTLPVSPELPNSPRFEKDALVVFEPVEFRGHNVGTVYLRYALDETRLRLYNFSIAVFLILLVAIVVLIPVSSSLQRLISQPIIDLAQTARIVSEQKNYSVRARKRQDDEVGFLIDQFNEMLDKIEKREKELESVNKQLAQSEQTALAATQAKSAFLANMSHEIRTPMNAILGFSQLMLRDPGATPKQRENLATINRSGEHLLNLINNILELSKIEAARITVNPITFDLHLLLRDVETMLRVRTDTKQLRFIVEIQEDVPQYAVGDENKIRQILINLLGNAVKFTREGGIVLRVRFDEEKQQQGQLIAEIEDTGTGISENEIASLFEAFKQAESGIKIGGGTGLGLAISRQFARMMGGEISVRSELGKGSCFRLQIPIVIGQSDQLQSQIYWRPHIVGLHPDQESRRILIADDEPDNRSLLVQMLTPIGFQIREVTNGAEAIREFTAWQPHLILMDMRMPTMDGYEAIRLIRVKPRGKEVKIISVTASAFEENRQESLKIGTDEFLRKPFREAELFEKIQKLLGVKYLCSDNVLNNTVETMAVKVPSPATLNALPGELIEQLCEAAIEGDFDKVLTLISHVEKHDSCLAQSLRTVAERFDSQHFIELLTEKGTPPCQTK